MTAPAYPHEALAVVFQIRSGALRVLLWRRGRDPEHGRWALPGGALAVGERLGASVARHLAESVDVDEIAHLEQLETRSDPDRDPRGRTLATAYLGLVPIAEEPVLPADTCWHPVDHLPPMAFDHHSIVESARVRLRAKLSYTTIAVALSPPVFTISTCGRSTRQCSATTSRRPICSGCCFGAVPWSPPMSSPRRGPSGGRPASLYRFTRRDVEVTDPFATFRPPED